MSGLCGRVHACARSHLDAKPDHVLRLARRQDPRGAVAEMIWNALDAEASVVEVEIQANDIEGVDRVIVRDNGHGMPAASCGSYFGDLGGSWKAVAKVSPTLHRPLQAGRARGGCAPTRWASSSAGRASRRACPAAARRPSSRRTRARRQTSRSTARTPPRNRPGQFDSRLPAENVDRLNHESAIAGLTAEFALFLTLHPEVRVTFRGEP